MRAAEVIQRDERGDAGIVGLGNLRQRVAARNRVEQVGQLLFLPLVSGNRGQQRLDRRVEAVGRNDEKAAAERARQIADERRRGARDVAMSPPKLTLTSSGSLCPAILLSISIAASAEGSLRVVFVRFPSLS